MAYYPISKVLPQYVDSNGDPYSGAVLKAYQAGTSTNISMATSYTGGTTATSIALDSNGNPAVSGNPVIPHVAEDYKLALYADQTAADADSGAIWSIDYLPAGIAYQTVTNHVRGEVFYIENDVGAGSTAFDVATNIGAAWESVGPTGSGATNIWTAMDNLPSGSIYVDLKIGNECADSTGAAINQYVALRKTGSSASVNAQSIAGQAKITATGATATLIKSLASARVPLDSSNRFDIYFVSDGTSRTTELYLIGAGV